MSVQRSELRLTAIFSWGEHMTQYELIKRVKKRKDVRTRDTGDSNEVNLICRALLDEMKKCVIRGEQMMIQEFFSLEVVDTKPQKRRNPVSGVVQEYPGAKTVKLKISTSLRDEINGRIEEEY